MEVPSTSATTRVRSTVLGEFILLVTLDRSSISKEELPMQSLAVRAPDDFDPPLDPGIARAVLVLRGAGVETFESCQGGEGHSYKEPAVRFDGEPAIGFRALAVAMENGLPVAALRRVWRMDYGEPTGPWWELVFSSHLDG